MPDSREMLARLRNRFSAELVVDAIGVSILCSLFLFWEMGRALYLIAAIFALVYVIRNRPRLPRAQLWYSLPIYGLIAVYGLSLMAHGFPDRGINMVTSRHFLLLLAVPLVSLTYSQLRRQRYSWYKYVLASIVLGALALVDILMRGKPRADADDNAVVFGFAAAAITAIVIASYRILRQQRHGNWLFFGAMTMGLVATLLSGSRGSWIAVIVFVCMALFHYLDHYSTGRRMALSAIVISSLFALSLSIPPVQQRLVNMVEIMSPYFNGGHPARFTSVSYRFEAWQAGWVIGSENPLLGVGPGHFRESLAEYVQRHPEYDGLQRLRHAHNQYMQSFAMAGWPGLLVLVSLLLCHGWLFGRYLSTRYPEQVRSLALAGLLLVVTYSILSLTGTPFDRRKLILLYGFSSASLWGGLLASLGQMARGTR